MSSLSPQQYGQDYGAPAPYISLHCSSYADLYYPHITQWPLTYNSVQWVLFVIFYVSIPKRVDL